MAKRFSALALLFSVACLAQNWFQGNNGADWVELASSPSVKIERHQPSKATLHFRIKPEMHINSHTPHTDLLIPTELVISNQKAIKLQPQYPPGHDITLPFDTEKLSVYSGDFTIGLSATATDAAAHKATLPAELKYQACNKTSCFPPKSLKFDVGVEVVP